MDRDHIIDVALDEVQLIPTQEKQEQEMASLRRIDDSFKKIIVVKDDIMPKRDESGIVTMGVLDFLLNPGSLDY